MTSRPNKRLFQEDSPKTSKPLGLPTSDNPMTKLTKKPKIIKLKYTDEEPLTMLQEKSIQLKDNISNVKKETFHN